jgi:hypothetical protein
VRYALSPYIKQKRFVFKGLNTQHNVFHLTRPVFANDLYTTCFDHSIIMCTVQKPEVQR